ncbi:MAG: zinc ribbon domain-containing protein [Pyrinomonadaceae bacterium]
MITCQNCGHANTDSSNFCRYCGIKFSPLGVSPIPRRQQIPQNPPPYGKEQPRPYSWKTDEFNLPTKTSARKTEQIGNVLQLDQFQEPMSPANARTQQYSMQHAGQGLNMISHGYRCPRCSTQLLPQVTKKVSAAGWVVFAVLLVTFFRCFVRLLYQRRSQRLSCL